MTAGSLGAQRGTLFSVESGVGHVRSMTGIPSEPGTQIIRVHSFASKLLMHVSEVSRYHQHTSLTVRPKTACPRIISGGASADP